MKKQNARILILTVTILSHFTLHAAEYTINTLSGTISVMYENYIDNMYEVWNINTPANKAVNLAYSVDLDPGYDFVYIYNVDSSGRQTLLAELTNYGSGNIYACTNSGGKIKIIFQTDGGASYSSGYYGFEIHFSMNDLLINNSDTRITGAAFVDKDLNVTGNLNAANHLNVSKNAFIKGFLELDGRAIIGNALTVNNQLSIYNSSSNNYGIYLNKTRSASTAIYGLHAISRNNGTGNVYGIYSNVAATSGKKWAGYFTGGDVEISDGELRLLKGNFYIGNANKSFMFYTQHAQATPTQLFIAPYTSAGGDFSKQMVYKDDGSLTLNGNLLINGGENRALRIDGDIYAKEVKIQTNVWSDFVFEKNYQLRSLSEVNNYIKTNGHLPEIPPANEVYESGINLAEMQIKLLQKIEELTLYAIQQQEEIQTLKAKIEKMEVGR